MEKCQYEQVDTKVNCEQFSENNTSWTPFRRQLLVNSGLWTTYFVTGLVFGAPTVAIPQFRRDNSMAVSDEMASWMSSALSYCAMPWVVILPVFTQYVGRKIPFYIAISTSVISLAITYFGHSTTHFLIGQITQSLLFGSNLTISVIMVTEYTSPRYRGIFLSIKSASVWWGILVSNIIGTVSHWNHIGLFGLMCSAYYVTVYFWPESPYWLASKGRFEECAKAHRWLKGVDSEAEEELEKLIKSQKEFLQNNSQHDTVKDKFRSFMKLIPLKEFYLPILLSVLVMAQFHSFGKIVCTIYSIELIKKITGSESTGYAGMLILDGVSVLGMYIGSFVSKFVRRRRLLLTCSVLGISFLFSFALYIWLVKENILKENSIVSLGLLAAFAVSISCGPVILSTSIYAELIPLRYKSSAVIITILMHFAFMATSIKVAPLIFRTFSLQGTFSLYGVLASVLTILLYKYLPETKDKTLQEIEEYFQGLKKSKADDMGKDAKELVELTN